MNVSLRLAPPRMSRGRRLRITAYLAFVALLTLTFHRFLFLGNFDVVDPGRVYRSAQPKEGLEQTLRSYRIATVLNLRGGSPKEWWFANEEATCARLGVKHVVLPMKANRRPPREKLLALLKVLENSRYPLLIHCKSGSDRTGLAVALYRLVQRSEAPEQAIEGFSLLRGHIPVWGLERLHEPIDEYAVWLHAQGLAHSPERFQRWVETEYRDTVP